MLWEGRKEAVLSLADGNLVDAFRSNSHVTGREEATITRCLINCFVDVKRTSISVYTRIRRCSRWGNAQFPNDRTIHQRYSILVRNRQ